ncbi:Uncharacterised protein [Acinetobacter baumannii]|nr:Uncharacterised protein [Acinetobacter baumannii]
MSFWHAEILKKHKRHKTNYAHSTKDKSMSFLLI